MQTVALQTINNQRWNGFIDRQGRSTTILLNTLISSGRYLVACFYTRKFNHFQTSGVTVEGGLTFAYNHEISKGTKVQYTDNGVTSIPELISGNEYYVLEGSSGLTTGKKEEGDFSGGAKARHLKLSLTKNGPAIIIGDGGGAANNKLRAVRPLAYDEVDWFMHENHAVPSGKHNTKFEPIGN